MKRFCSFSALALAVVLLAAPAMAASLIVPDNGNLTANLPPNPGVYVSPADIHLEIQNGGVTLARGDARHRFFFNEVVRPGGILNGEIEIFDSVLEIHFVGDGPLKGWSRTISVPARSETHTAPRKPGESVQSFDTVMYRLEGGIKGDKDFEYLSIVAGTANGLDSPGHTTLYQQKDGRWLVDSNFNITYKASFKGARGSKLEGLEDSFDGVITMTAVAPETAR
jgi:hypothetical protein